MKKIIFLCCASLFSTGIFAAPLSGRDLSEKILKLFHQDFPEIANPSIFKDGENYTVYFTNLEDNSQSRIFYDSKGRMLETFKYYSCEQLAPFIRTKINSTYKGKDITSVTEVTNSLEHYYHIVLEDSKSMFVINVNADENGEIYLAKKYKRA